MKRSLKLLWRGLTGLLTYLAEWFTVILGMKDESKYGIILRRTVGTCFAILMLMFTGMILWCVVGEYVCNHVCNYVEKWVESGEIPPYGNEDLSPALCYHSELEGGNGFLYLRDGRKVLKGIDWIVTPEGSDTLACYSDGKLRGYFSILTGNVVIKPTYKHAWVFSEGLAAVEDSGEIKFIDPTGRVVFNPHVRYIPGEGDYVFHNKGCVVTDKTGCYRGLIDKQGHYVLPATYESVCYCDSFWMANAPKQHLVLNQQLDTVLYVENSTDLRIAEEHEWFEVTMTDHTLRTYTFQGQLINDFYIQSVNKLMYETNEIYYTDPREYDVDTEQYDDEPRDFTPSYRMAVANCLTYESAGGWYGLMTPAGKIITPPSYRLITAHGPDLYLCSYDGYDVGVLLNSKGEPVE